MQRRGRVRAHLRCRFSPLSHTHTLSFVNTGAEVWTCSAGVVGAGVERGEGGGNGGGGEGEVESWSGQVKSVLPFLTCMLFCSHVPLWKTPTHTPSSHDPKAHSYALSD